MRQYPGQFEQLILMAMARLGDDAYRFAIYETLRERTRRRPSVGAIYTALRRMEQKGLVRSFTGMPKAVRGGRAKKHLVLTSQGRAALREAHEAIASMAEGVPRP